jgi:hypothetical protein
MPAGRPNEGRVRLNIHVLPETAEAINRLLNKADGRRNTQGKVVDHQFSKKLRRKPH